MRTARCSAFGLIELVVVLAVLGALLALLLPAVQSARRAAANVQCQNQLKQVALALHAHHDSHARLPGVIDVYGSPELHPRPGSGQDVCWPARLLPYLDQGPLWAVTQAAQAQIGNPLADPPHAALSTRLAVLSCPADSRTASAVTTPQGRRVALTSYFGVSGSGDGIELYRPPTRAYDGRGMFVERAGVAFAEVRDGLSNTLLLGERPPDPIFESGWWYTANGNTPLPPQPVLAVTGVSNPTLGCQTNGREENLNYGEVSGAFVYGPGRADNRCDAFHYWSLHLGGANWALADGSVRFLPYSTRSVLKALSTRAAGEVAAVP